MFYAIKAMRIGRGRGRGLGEYCTHSKKNSDIISVRKTERNRLVGRPRCRWEDHLKINFREAS
jgi:hypothetical protein